MIECPKSYHCKREPPFFVEDRLYQLRYYIQIYNILFNNTNKLYNYKKDYLIDTYLKNIVLALSPFYVTNPI